MHDAERIRYYFARRCHQWRDERTPSGITWRERFEQVTSRSLDDYMRECVETDMRRRVIEHELSVFGWSPLAGKA